MDSRSLLALTGAAVFAASAAAQPIALTGATVYDGTGAVLPNAVVMVENGRLACVGADCAVPAGAEVVDLSGQFVTPGLVDAHVHHAQTGWLDGRPDSRIGLDLYDYDALQASLRANPDRWHRAYLCSGITAVYDVGGPLWTLDLEAESENDPERAHVRAAGPLLTHFAPIFETATGESFLPMQTDEEARASVRTLAERGAGAVKVWYIAPSDDQREVLDARLMRIGEEARTHGLPLIVHATELREAKTALRAGAAMLVHSVRDAPLDDEFIRLAREANTVYAPTLTVGPGWRRAVASAALGAVYPLDDPNGCVDAETRRVIADAPALQATLPASMRAADRAFGGLEAVGQGRTLMDANLRRAHEAGLTIATATDAGNPLTVHGPSIYAEMEAMEGAGLSPADILVMSTRNGALAMGRLDDFGTLEAGKLADLIVLTDDPGASARAFRSITHVMRMGVLREIRQFAAGPSPPAAPVSPGALVLTESDLAELIRLDAELARSQIVDRDSTLFAQVAVDGFRVLAPGGKVEGKVAAIQGLQAWNAQGVEVSGQEVVTHGPVALVIGRLDIDGEMRPVGRWGPLKFMSVWVREAGAWRLVSRSVTPCHPMADARGFC